MTKRGLFHGKVAQLLVGPVAQLVECSGSDVSQRQRETVSAVSGDELKGVGCVGVWVSGFLYTTRTYVSGQMTPVRNGATARVRATVRFAARYITEDARTRSLQGAGWCI